MKLYENQLITTSYLFPYLYYIEPDFENGFSYKVKLVKLKKNSPFGDFAQIDGETVLTGSVHWLDNMLIQFDIQDNRILKNFKIKPIRKPVMSRFTASRFIATKHKNRVYFAESIDSNLRFLNLQTGNFENKIELSPPFFKPMPEEYKVDKLDRDAHFKWMYSWTALNQILVKDKFIIVNYRKGYSFDNGYEIINQKDLSSRYYLDFSKTLIYDFSVTKSGLKIEFFEIAEDDALLKCKSAHLILK